MAIDFEIYKPKKSLNKARGDLGQVVVAKRLAMAGWKCGRMEKKNVNPDNVPIDLKTISKNGEVRLVEVKARKFYSYRDYDTGETVECLALSCSQLDNYDNFSRLLDKPLDIYWVNFYEGKIWRQELQTLLVPCEVSGLLFPRTHLIKGQKRLLFPVDQFETYSNIAQEEKWQFEEIGRKYSDVSAD